MNISTRVGGHFLEYYDSVLSKVSEKMYTARAKEIADIFVSEMKKEINQCYTMEQLIESLFSS